jgi:hypothetical protein
MFGEESGWIWGVYFATNLKSWDSKEFTYDEKKILNDLIGVENRMTEYVTPKFLKGNCRNIDFLDIRKIDKNGDCALVDEHQNYSLKWCVPLIEMDTDNLYHFIFNEFGGTYFVDIFINDVCRTVKVEKMGYWTLLPIGNLSNVDKIEIFVDKKLRNNIIFDNDNREKFKQNNFFYYEK